jgi:hypothetical protein
MDGTIMEAVFGDIIREIEKINKIAIIEPIAHEALIKICEYCHTQQRPTKEGRCGYCGAPL